MYRVEIIEKLTTFTWITTTRHNNLGSIVAHTNELSEWLWNLVGFIRARYKYGSGFITILLAKQESAIQLKKGRSTRLFSKESAYS